MRLVVGAVVRDESRYIHAMIRSVDWVDAIVVYDDYSTDGTGRIVRALAGKPGIPDIDVVGPLDSEPMMRYLPSGGRDTSNEMRVRNAFVDLVFRRYSPCVCILLDADEMLSRTILPYISTLMECGRCDSIALTCTHLYDEARYVHVYPTMWNGVELVDPHVRILKRVMHYEPGAYPHVPDCFIRPTEATLCLDIGAHVHLKYLKRLRHRNDALRFLPGEVERFEKSQALRPIRFPIPPDLQPLLAGYVG